MELEVLKPIEVSDGMHKGKITKVEYRETPYKYTDVFIQLDGEDVVLKHGCPTTVSKNSKLGKLLAEFAELKEGEKVDPEKLLVGQAVQFMTVNEKTDKGVFARVVAGSVKPVEAAPEPQAKE